MLAHVLDWQRVQLYTHFTDEVARGPARPVPRPGPPPLRGRAGGLPGRPQGVLLPALRGLAGRAHPAARVGVRRRRVPGPDQGPRIGPRRGRGHRLGLPGRSPRPHRHPGARFVAIDLSEAGPGRRPQERRPARRRRPHRIPPRRPAGAGRRRGALRRDRLQPALHPDRRHPDGSRPASGTTSRTWPSTAAPTASTWSRADRTVRPAAQAGRPPDPRDRHRPGEARPRPDRGPARASAWRRRSTTTPSIPGSSARPGTGEREPLA